MTRSIDFYKEVFSHDPSIIEIFRVSGLVRVKYKCPMCGSEVNTQYTSYKNKTTKLCKSCIISQRNKSDKMRQIASKNGIMAYKKIKEYANRCGVQNISQLESIKLKRRQKSAGGYK